jgi:DNA-binding transcriptional LysR family regulator
MNQPTISNALARLRKQLDDPLFVRDGRKMAPTPRAKKIIVPVRRALKEIQSIGEQNDTFDPKTTIREFRIQMFSTIELGILQHLIEQIEGTNISIELIPFHSMDTETAIITNTAELAIGLTPAEKLELEWEDLCSLDIVIMARKGNPKMYEGIDLEGINNIGQVQFNMHPSFNSPGSKSIPEKLIIDKQPAPKPTLRTNHEFEMTAVVSVTDLIAMVPIDFAKTLPSWFNVEFYKSPITGPKQPVCMIWKQSAEEDKGLAWLRQEIRVAAKKITEKDIKIIGG